jgi:hypothetical protein
MGDPEVIELVMPYTGITTTCSIEEVDSEFVMRYLGPLIGLKHDEQQTTQAGQVTQQGIA